jgi:hypothetical protein
MLMLERFVQRLARLGIPQPRGLVSAPREDGLPIGADRYRILLNYKNVVFRAPAVPAVTCSAGSSCVSTSK